MMPRALPMRIAARATLRWKLVRNAARAAFETETNGEGC
jgi:hypothetical protein